MLRGSGRFAAVCAANRELKPQSKERRLMICLPVLKTAPLHVIMNPASAFIKAAT